MYYQDRKVIINVVSICESTGQYMWWNSSWFHLMIHLSQTLQKVSSEKHVQSVALILHFELIYLIITSEDIST